MKPTTRLKISTAFWTTVTIVPVIALSLLVIILWIASIVVPGSILEPPASRAIRLTHYLFNLRDHKIRMARYKFFPRKKYK